MQWNVIISKSIEDQNEDLGIFNWNFKGSNACQGLNTLVSAKIKDREWALRVNSSPVHGIEDGSEVWTQEIFLIPKTNKKLSYSGETKIFHSKSLQTIDGQIGLIELVNQEIKEKRWDIRSNPLGFSTHDGEPCWHIRLYGISQNEEE
jgi:hypothetical protein